MKNKIYQFMWYKIARMLIPVGKDLNGFIRNHKRIRAQLALSRLFGTIHGVLLGDSEHGQFDYYGVMSKFDDLTLNLAIGGTTPKDLMEYFTGIGKDVYLKIKKHSARKIISTGGNCSLRCQMSEIPGTLQEVHGLIPDSIIILIPPVYSGIIAKIYAAAKIDKPESQVLAEIDTIRRAQRSIWSPFVIDTYTPFLDPRTGGPVFGVLQDPVHFGRAVVDLIQKIYNKII